MIHHQEILCAIGITVYGSCAGDILKLDGQASRGSGAILVEGARGVRKPDDSAEGLARLAKYSMP
jgi:hypothetical protein